MKTFPQLCFLQPQMHRQGHLVYVNDMSREVLVEDRKSLHEEMYNTTSDTETDTENRLPQSTSLEEKNQQHIMKEQLLVALKLPSAIEDVKP